MINMRNVLRSKSIRLSAFVLRVLGLCGPIHDSAYERVANKAIVLV